ncbi:ABC transporter substrate-binding protein [Desertivibrio insolitus]|uniref:ABC transporter substrate-binding protein n=1 Tax=Herbiconiux sp. SYSU D00978 TaxID=2812562 RepID=UPI001A96EC6B|nr:sugar ABC transporter substrate-binding protein [Herbiconiux sp. SYSU D00978]
MQRPTRRGIVTGAALTAVAALTLSGCAGSGAGESASGDQTITVWAWEPTLEQVAADFEAENEGVTVELVNAGTGNDQYTALQNAIAAGSGLPDVAQIEYYAVPQFALAGSLADLNEFGASDLEDTFTPGPWGSVALQDGVFGLPMDSGPMALFYNEEVFAAHNVAVPTTWDEYLEAARALHAADPNLYIANDTGDAGFTTSMIWQAGGQPYQVDGTDVTIDFSDEGTTRFAELWQQLIEEDLVAPISSWSDEWYQGLGDGSIASLTIGAWMPANLESGVPDGAGKWRVAPMPQWEAGANATAENGGSSLAIPADADNKELAYEFIEYANAGDGVQTRVDGGAFPATTAELTSDEFLGAEFEYFGGQKVNEVLSASAENVVEGWSYLPFQVYANSIFNDTAGQAYVGGTTLTDGLSAWQDASAKYGAEQGFTVN